MKKILALALLLTLLYSCNRSVTPYDAATHHYNSCKNMRIKFQLFEFHQSLRFLVHCETNVQI